MSRRVVWSLIAVVLLISGVGIAAFLASGTDEPEMFMSKDGRYKVLFPTRPELEAKRSRGGTQFFIATASEPNGVYIVMYADVILPPNDTVENRLVEAQKGVARSLGGTISKEMAIDKPFPGREFEGTVNEPKNGEMRVKLVLVKTRLYQVEVVGTHDFVSSKKANKFLETFEILE